MIVLMQKNVEILKEILELMSVSMLNFDTDYIFFIYLKKGRFDMLDLLIGHFKLKNIDSIILKLKLFGAHNAINYINDRAEYFYDKIYDKPKKF